MKRIIKKITLLLAIAMLLTIAPPTGIKSASASSHIVSYVYRYADLVEDVETELTKHNDIVSWEIAGYSVENRKIYAIALGKGPNHIVITAGVHARETANTPMIMNAMFDIIDAYVDERSIENTDIKTLLDDEVTLVIMPLVNPDGYEYCMAYNNGSKKTNANGVNLNRNFPTKYYGFCAPANPSEITNQGPFAASEPETKAVMSIVDRYDYIAGLDIHSRGRIIYATKPGIEDHDIANGMAKASLDTRALSLANAVSRVSGYNVVIEKMDYSGGEGTVTDYMFESGIPAICIETMKSGSSQPAPISMISNEYLQRLHLKESLIEYINTALSYTDEYRHTIKYMFEGEEMYSYTIRDGLFFNAVPPFPEIENAKSMQWNMNLTGIRIYKDYTINLDVEYKSYTVNYILDGNIIHTENILYEESITNIPTLPERTGYDQTPPAWSQDLSGISITQDYDIEAIYTPNSYTLTFATTKIKEDVLYGQPIGPLPQLISNDETLVGWYLTEDLLASSKVTSAYIYLFLEDIVLYPKIVPNNTEPHFFGDVDGDNEISASDAASILRYIVRAQGLNAFQRHAADVNADGDLSATDSAIILRYLVRLEDQSQIEQPI